MNQRIQALCQFLDSSHSTYHALANLAHVLEENGYKKLTEMEDWELVPGGKYYVTRGNSTAVAFRIPHCDPHGFMMCAGHVDHPAFKLKENCELPGTYPRVAVERYGSMILSPWLDRPLSIAGRVLVETEEGAEFRLLDIDQDLMLIPNVAIHMNRQMNDGYAWNPAIDCVPLLGSVGTHGMFRSLLEKAAGGKILGHDLYLYIRQKASVWGIDGSLLSSAALDDLECVWASLQGFLRAKESRSIPVFVAFDSEEVGSCSAQGADSTMLSDVLSRIANTLNLNVRRMLSQSFLVSADNAHAIHPNHPELADPCNAPVLGGGVVLKFNARLKYSTDGKCAAVFRKICKNAGVPVQSYYNRSDIAGGSTLGHIALSHVSVPTIDIGLPQLAMHSCYETAAIADVLYMEDAMTAYFSTTLESSEEGFSLS